MGITMRMYAQRKGWDVGQVEIRLAGEKEGPGVLSRIRVHIELPEALGDAERARLKEIAARCPTHKALSSGVAIVHL